MMVSDTAYTIANAEDSVARVVTLTRENQLLVHLPSIEEDNARTSSSPHPSGDISIEEHPKGRKQRATLVAKEYNLRNRHSDEADSDGAPSHRPGPGLAQHSLFDCTLGFIHAACDYVGRRALWQYIVDLHCNNLCLIGDFNAVLGAHERHSSHVPNGVSCADFRVFIGRELLFEVEAVRAAFTWASRRSSLGLISSKLDRLLAHEGFIDNWNSVSATVLARTASDHHPLLLQCDMGLSHTPRPFKFQSSWTLDSRFPEMVQSSWTRPLRASDPILLVVRKLKRLKNELRVWNKEVFGLIGNKLAAAKRVLSEVQGQVYDFGDSEDLFNKEIEATVEINQILTQEQFLYAQKNRATWLRHGDRNTAFFQRLHRIKKAKSGIHAMLIDGNLTSDQATIRAHIEQFYMQLFSASAGPADFGVVPDLITPSVTSDISRKLSDIPGLDEIKAVVFGLSGDSNPGPDGFGGVFNPDMSKAYFGKHVSAQNKASFRATLNIGSAALPFTYLGVPLFRGVPMAAHLRSTTDRIISKFVGWKCSSLSLAGRACLINLVIVSSLVHSMMIYRWPRSLLNKVDRAMRNFLWTGSIEKTGFCIVNWTKVCAPKEEGVFGIRNIMTANEVFLQCLAWNILNSTETSMLFVRVRFFMGKKPRTHYITSSVWRGVHNHVHHILKDARWILGRHSSVNFWLDNWLGYSIADRRGIPNFVRDYVDFSVADYFFDDA
ncbi:hypothetical protein ACS0TY_012702 [Phlomoides rotata]